MPDPMNRLHAEIRACRRCVTAGFLPMARPIVHGAQGQRRMILGQAPGIRAADTGIPWAGASGRVLRDWLRRAGEDAADPLDAWYLTSVTKCFPGRAVSGGGDRLPSRGEQVLCRPWLDQELVLVRPVVVVALGRLAAETLVPSIRGTRMEGFVGAAMPVTFPWGESVVLPLPHPSGVSRWMNDPANRLLVDRGLAWLREFLMEDRNPV